MSGRRPRSRASLARRLALKALERIDARDAFAQDVIASVIDDSPLQAADRAFSTRLVLGVVSMQGSLDAVLDRCMDSPSDAKPDLRRALRISAYEIIYLDKSPHAALHQGVELAKCVAPRAAGLANAVLRRVLAARGDFPFGDPATDLAALSLKEGFPLWLTERLARDLGEDAVREFEAASGEVAPAYVYENPLKAAPGEVAATFDALGGCEPACEVEGVAVSGCLRLAERRDLASDAAKALFEEGKAIVSDASAQAVARICAQATAGGNGACDAEAAGGPSGDANSSNGGASRDATPPKKVDVLELCAGRGTKTVLVQGAFERLGVRLGRYVAVDNVAFKCDLLARRAELCGARVDECLRIELGAEPGPISGGGFDLVLLDAPCSGVGTLRRHPEIRWRLTPEVVAENAERDASLLRHAAVNVAVGGHLAYATCTPLPEEDELVVEAFLESPEGEGFRMVPATGSAAFFKPRLAPGGPDAHFCALMQRIA